MNPAEAPREVVPGPAFERRGGELYCEQAALAEIARRHGTPTYVYSRRAIEQAYAAYANALAGRHALVCYAIKANSNLAILDLLGRAGAGFDIVSGGELARVLAAGGDPRRIVFSGVGKLDPEIAAALRANILCFNVESQAELAQVARVAAGLGRRAPISLRVNPDVDAKTHPYISTGLRENKFGVAYEDALSLYKAAAADRHLDVVGIDCHIGSQITEVAPYLDAAERILDLVDDLARAGIGLHHIDFGGGLGIRYREETPPSAAELIAALLDRVDRRGHGDRLLMFEPGRSLVGNAGVLLTKVNLLKSAATRNFAVVDAAMNDLIRPTLYGAWMDVQPVVRREAPSTRYDVVGPVCESGDWLARDRDLAIAPGDLLAILGAGAYAMSMASNYNSRARAAEVIVDGGSDYCVRRRERIEDLYAGESLLPPKG
ncbi:MAG TPA: diaminopimelate decarboxylase [Burkholderiaceae bacterium]|nr:diaminopimelate decarboxylase [Burkholderiaceae bacterium]